MVEKVASSQPLTIADEGVRFQRLTRPLFAAVWLVPSLLAAIQLALVGDASGTPYGFVDALVWQGSTWLLWSLWSQLILSLVGLVPLGSGRAARWFAVHIATMSVVCIRLPPPRR